MDYLDNIAKGLEVSYVDLLERINEKYGKEEFVLSSANLKALRRNRWQTSATNSGVNLAPNIFEALDKMAEQEDPCIKILDSSGKKYRLLKLPALRGKAAIRTTPKEVLVEENVALRAKIEQYEAELAEKQEALDKKNEELERERHSVEYYKQKAGEQVEVVEEDYDQFPSCYKDTDYSQWLPPFQESNGKRPAFVAIRYWDNIAVKLKFIATWVTYEEKRFNEKLSAAVRAKINAGKIAPKASKVGPGLRTVISQYFRFIAMTNGLTRTELKPTKDHLLSMISLNAYLEFYSQYTKSPKTVINAAKIFSGLLKYMLTLRDFQHQTWVINTINRNLLDAIKEKKKQNSHYRAKHQLETQMALRGEWLNHIELSELNKLVSEELVDFLEAFETVTPKKMEVFQFQRALILFCFLQTGGQRREVIIGFQTDNFAMLDDNVVHFTLQEKVQKRNTDRLTLPDTLGKLLRIWIDKYRKILCPPENDVTQCFVTFHGKPMQPQSMSFAVLEKIEKIMPGHRIGPLSLRRILVTEMLHAAAKNPLEFFQWSAKHAALINTSKTMTETVYNCGDQAKQSHNALGQMNTTLNMNPSEHVSTTVDKHAAKVTYLTNKEEKVEAIVGRRWHEGELQYECKLANGECHWQNYGTLIGVTQLVHKFLKADSIKKQGKKAPPVLQEQPPTQQEPNPVQQIQPAVQQQVQPVVQLQVQQDNLPLLETDASDSESEGEDFEVGSECDSECGSDIDFGDVEAFGGDAEDESMDEDIDQAVSRVAPETSRKRKRSDSSASPIMSCNSPEPACKRHKSKSYKDVKLDNKRVAKLGDILSINPPKKAKEKFWLAKVISISTKRRVVVQWLDRIRPNQYKLLKGQDDVNVGAINKVASGTWTDTKIFKLGKV